MRSVIASSQEVVDRAGDPVSVDKWEAEANTYSSSLFQAAATANNPESLENSIVSHFNANPYSDWVYVRSCACIPTAYVDGQRVVRIVETIEKISVLTCSTHRGTTTFPSTGHTSNGLPHHCSAPGYTRHPR